MSWLKRKHPKTEEEKAADWAEFVRMNQQSEKVIRDNPGLFPTGSHNLMSEMDEFVDWQKRQQSKGR